MNSLKTPLIVSPLPDGRKWRIVRQFKYKKFTVPVGFVTDFASVPRLTSPIFTLMAILFILIGWTVLGVGLLIIISALSWFRPYGKHNKAAVLHDYLYQMKLVSRKQADDIFKETMRELKVAPWRRFFMYWAVRFFAWIGY